MTTNLQNIVSLDDERVGMFLEGKPIYPGLDVFGGEYERPASMIFIKSNHNLFLILPARKLTDDETAALGGIIQTVETLTPNNSEPVSELTINMHTGQPFPPDVDLVSEVPATPPSAPKLPKRGSL